MTSPRLLPPTDLEVAAPRAAFDQLAHARILLTGGTGFLGKWLLESFVFAGRNGALPGATLTVLARDPEAFLCSAPHLRGVPALRWVAGDIRTVVDLPAGFTHVIHAAAPVNAALPPGEVFDVIVEGTRRLLSQLTGPRPRFLFLSSGAVYGRQPDGLARIPEEHLGAPDPLGVGSTYGIAKRTAEHLVALSSTDPVIARIFALSGPHLPTDGRFALGNFLRDGLQGAPIVVQGDGTPHRSYLYVAEATQWLWTLLVSGQSGRAYNVGSDQALSIGELAETVARHFGVPHQILRTPPPGAVPERYIPSIDRIGRELGLRPQLTLQDGLARTTAWLRSS